MREIAGDEYTVLGEYVNNKKNILMLHTRCGYEWYVKPNHFINTGTRCPRCCSSKGETRIAKYLESRGFGFHHQYRFDNCRVKLPLPFDFKLEVEGQLIVVEFDGEQHFKPINFSGDETKMVRDFYRRRHNDRIKTEYCRANGIPLIRIDYTQFDEIEAILDRELSALGVTGKRSNTDNNDITRKEDAA